MAQLNARGVYVLLDMHQDILSSAFCLYDGAPRWVIEKSVADLPAVRRCLCLVFPLSSRRLRHCLSLRSLGARLSGTARVPGAGRQPLHDIRLAALSVQLQPRRDVVVGERADGVPPGTPKPSHQPWCFERAGAT